MSLGSNSQVHTQKLPRARNELSHVQAHVLVALSAILLIGSDLLSFSKGKGCNDVNESCDFADQL